jgi:transcriptional regulator with XRE-family HTH domain
MRQRSARSSNWRRSRFGERAKALLVEKGLSTEELAARSQMAVVRIEHILAGSLARLTLRDMTVIAGILGKPLECLLVPTSAPARVVPPEIIEEG